MNCTELHRSNDFKRVIYYTLGLKVLGFVLKFDHALAEEVT